MSPVVETILFVFGLVALGYLAGLTGYLKAEVGDALTEFAVGVALPLLLFRTMVGADFHGSAPWALWTAYFAAAAVAWLVGHLATTRIFGRDSQAGVVGGVASAYSNLVLLGIPFMLGVFGQEGFEVLSLLIAVHMPAMTMVSIILFDIFGHRKTGTISAGEIFRAFLRRVLPNSLMIGILAGVIWRVTGFDLPPFVVRLIDSLADIAGPLALFAMGLGLRKFSISGNVLPGGGAVAAEAFPDAGRGARRGASARPAADDRQGCGRGRGPAFRRQFLPARRAVRHRTGAGVEPDDHRHRLRSRHHGVLADRRARRLRLGCRLAGPRPFVQ